MALVPIFHGNVTLQAELVLAETERVQRRTHLRSLAGKDVEIIVRKRREQRSLDQNGYIHKWPIPLVADFCGYTIPEAKLVLMGECFGWKKVAGRDVPMKPSTADMSVEECTYFIDWVVPWAKERLGVTVPLPGEVAA